MTNFQFHGPRPFCAWLVVPQSPGVYFHLDEFQDCPQFSGVCYTDTPTSPSANICIFLLLCNKYPHIQHLKINTSTHCLRVAVEESSGMTSGSFVWCSASLWHHLDAKPGKVSV